MLIRTTNVGLIYSWVGFAFLPVCTSNGEVKTVRNAKSKWEISRGMKFVATVLFGPCL